MEGREAKVASFCKGHRVFHGFLVPYLTNQYHVRRLAQCVGQGVIPAVSVRTYFTLVDDTAFMGVHEFDRVFNRDDVAFGFLVPVINECRHGGRFTGPGWACNENNTTGFLDRFL